MGVNTERLKELADRLLEANGSKNIQGLLEQLRAELENLSGDPGNPDF